MIRGFVKYILKSAGYDLTRRSSTRDFPVDFDDRAIDVIRKVQPFTMTSPERIFALIEAVRYVSRANVVGSIVECGVWKGGSMMAVALTLQQVGIYDRHLYLFDTFAGMTPPTDIDESYNGEPASVPFASKPNSKNSSSWCYASRAEVEENLARTQYAKQQIHLVEGDVKLTIPDQAPQNISILRLDTDWYESTLHELVHLYPRLSNGGVLIVDDYGHWRGSRKAVDEFFCGEAILLNRIDYTGRMWIKHEAPGGVHA